MKNLASDRQATTYVIEELEEAGIELVPCLNDMKHYEVPSAVAGKLGDFTFRRYWYYWVVNGSMPAPIARVMNATWAHIIRVDGYAGGTDVTRPMHHRLGVTTYHVDEQNGLNLIAEVVRLLPSYDPENPVDARRVYNAAIDASVARTEAFEAKRRESPMGYLACGARVQPPDGAPWLAAVIAASGVRHVAPGVVEFDAPSKKGGAP